MFKESQETFAENRVNQSFLILKPHIDISVKNEILNILKISEYKVSASKEFEADINFVFSLYPDLYGEEWIVRAVESFTGGKCLALVVNGMRALDFCQKLKLKMRKKYAIDHFRNVMHVADSREELIHDVGLVFPDRFDLLERNSTG